MEIEAALRSLDKSVELHVIDAPYGHDSFLLGKHDRRR